MKKLSIFIVALTTAFLITGCGKVDDDWQKENNLGEISEVETIQEIKDDYSEAKDIDKVLHLSKMQDEVHFASLRLFTDAYNSTLYEHMIPLRTEGYWHADEGTQETGRYNFEGMGILNVKAENEKIYYSEFSTSTYIDIQDRAIYATNLVYHIVPQVNKQDLTGLYRDLYGWCADDNILEPPMFIRNGYSVTFEAQGRSAKSGFVMKISKTN